MAISGSEWLLWGLGAATIIACIGMVAAIMIAGRETVRRRRIKKVLRRQIREAKRHDHACSHFLASTSHDLRQPLQAAGMFGEVLALRLSGTPHEPVVARLRESIEAASFLLSAVLDVSTLDMGKIQPTLDIVALDGMMSRLYQQMEQCAVEKSLRFKYVPTKARVVTDPMLLERMLRNLLTNAFTYTDKGGIVFGCRHHGSKIGIQIVDTGVGIPNGKLRDIFEDFFRLGPKNGAANLGLGLGIVRRMAHLLGYAIKVQSVEGRGSSFTVWIDFPAQQP